MHFWLTLLVLLHTIFAPMIQEFMHVKVCELPEYVENTIS